MPILQIPLIETIYNMKTLQTKIFDTDGNIYYSPKSLAVFSEGMAEIVKDKKQDCTIRVIKINSKNQ